MVNLVNISIIKHLTKQVAQRILINRHSLLLLLNFGRWWDPVKCRVRGRRAVHMRRRRLVMTGLMGWLLGFNWDVFEGNGRSLRVEHVDLNKKLLEGELLGV